jgi:hypothetical protein
MRLSDQDKLEKEKFLTQRRQGRKESPGINIKKALRDSGLFKAPNLGGLSALA